MKTKIKYYVAYGDNTSREPCRNLDDVNAFVAHCLRNNIRIREVTKA